MLAVENQNKYAISLLSETEKQTKPKNLWQYITRNPVSLCVSVYYWSSHYIYEQAYSAAFLVHLL